MTTQNNAQDRPLTREVILSATEPERAYYALLVAGLRRQQGMTQAELALAANVSRGTIRNIETGAMTPQSEKLAMIFTALDAFESDGFEDVRPHLAVIAPLLQRIEPSYRPDAVSRVVGLLSDVMVAHPNVPGSHNDVRDAIPVLEPKRERMAREAFRLAAKRGENEAETPHAD